jgi:hypothetical protein
MCSGVIEFSPRKPGLVDPRRVRDRVKCRFGLTDSLGLSIVGLKFNLAARPRQSCGETKAAQTSPCDRYDIDCYVFQLAFSSRPLVYCGSRCAPNAAFPCSQGHKFLIHISCFQKGRTGYDSRLWILRSQLKLGTAADGTAAR